MATEQELTRQQNDTTSLMRLIDRMATDPELDVEKLEKMLALKDQWEKTEARKAWVAAMAAFKAENIIIVKDKTVAFKDTKYKHASIGNVVGIITGALGKHGLSHRWNIVQDAQSKAIRVTCILTHALGHSEETTLEGMPDNSGSKNPIQQVASTVSYLERYTLLAATGLATNDQEDTDGNFSTERDDDADAKAEVVKADWLAAIAECDTVASLNARKAEMVSAYGNSNRVPSELKKACADKLTALQAAK